MLLLLIYRISANTFAFGNSVCKAFTLLQCVVHSVSVRRPAWPKAKAPLQIEQTVIFLSEHSFSHLKNSLSALKAMLSTYLKSIPGTKTKSPSFNFDVL